MHATLPLLQATDFPAVRRARLETLQVNLGYRCNLSCVHCHVGAGPKRTEAMDRDTAEQVVRFLDVSRVSVLDLTGGAPEMNPNFCYLVSEARARGIRVIDRCNLAILNEPGFEDLADFLAEQKVEVVASLPCYLEKNVDHQRGRGVYNESVAGLKKLNTLGYGHPRSGLVLNLVYNPQGPRLPPPQVTLERDYRRELHGRFGIVFNQLLVLANMPIGRFGSVLVSKGQFASYMSLLRGSHEDANLETVMCRRLINVDWRGYVYDCDFNHMLGLAMRMKGGRRVHLSELVGENLIGRSIVVGDHCYGCTAGQGSSCGGALT
jgi:radical SAM/Cys-rich protein